uniref:Uncharacterized protein n=1 Tax=Accipiter nisus TaxID=211598 RepID=A0A8B9RVW0_9AVES
ERVALRGTGSTGGMKGYWEAVVMALGVLEGLRSMGKKDISDWSESANGSLQMDALSLESASKEAYFSRVETFTISFLTLVCDHPLGKEMLPNVKSELHLVQL